MSKFFKGFSRFDANMAMTITAVVISLCALFVSFAEVRIMRSQQKASLYPYLTIGQSYNEVGYGLYLHNKGIGPASINSFQVFDNSQYFTNWLELANHYLPDSLSLGYDVMRMNNIQNTIISPGEKIELVYANWTPASRLLQSQLGDLDFMLCYSSLLGDHWTIKGYGKPESINESCERMEEREMY
ncbi:MAG: hypothetical protein AAF433_12375 [Bacteroidota bacterium]